MHFDAAVKGGYPKGRTRGSKWDIGLDFEYFKKQFNAEAHAVIEIPPLDFTTGANVLVSNKGLAACLYFKTFLGTWRPGAGACGATARRCTCSAATSRTTRSSSSTRSRRHRDRRHRAARAGLHVASAGVPVVASVPAGGHGNSAGLVKLAGRRLPPPR